MSLIHWWPLNGDTQDRINNTALITNDAIYTNGKISQALQMTNTISKIPNPFINLNDWSFACWIREDDKTILWRDYFCFSKNLLRLELDNASNWRWYCGEVGTGNTYPDTGDLFASGTIVNTGVNNNVWYHVAITKTGAEAKFYLNGILKATTSLAKNFTSESAMLYFNSRATETTNASMGLNDVRCYDHALSAAEVKELSKALVVHYTFDDELATNMLYNETGLIQPADIKNITIVDDSAIGNYSLSCNGNTYITHNPEGDASHGVTVSMWIKYNNDIDGSTWVAFADANSQLGFGSYKSTSGTYGVIAANNGTNKRRLTNLVELWKNKQWNHVVVTMDLTNTINQCWINGIEGSYGDSDFWSHDNYLTIGARYLSNEYSRQFNGMIDDFRLYHTQLSPEEIKELYNCGGRISNLGDALTGEFIEGAERTSVNKNHTITTKEIYEQILPTEYQQLEYIESYDETTSIQDRRNPYIDLGWKPTLPVKASIQITTTDKASTDDGIIFGASYAGTAFLPFYIYRGNWYLNGSSIATPALNNTYYEASINYTSTSQTLTINGESYTQNQSLTIPESYTTWIFDGYWPSPTQYNRGANVKLHRLTISSENNIQKDLIPARRISDGELGLYDIINNDFYINANTNVNTWPFIAGPTITTGQASMLRAGGLTAREIIEI